MPFGLKGAPPTFQRLMGQEVLTGHLRYFIMVYLDDIIVYSTNHEEHVKHLQLVSNGSKFAACNALRKNVTSASEKSSTWGTSFPLKATATSETDPGNPNTKGPPFLTVIPRSVQLVARLRSPVR
jgi:hypothetical protein